MSKFALLFLVVFFGGIVAALAYSGVAAFVLYQLVYFLNPDARWWSASIPGLRYSMITVLLMMLVLALRYREYSALSPWLKMPVFKWMIAVLGMYYLAYTFAINLPLHKNFTFEYTKLVIIMLVAYKLISNERALTASLWAYIVGATYIGYLAHSVGRGSQGRVSGIGMVDAVDTNDAAAALVPAAVILMYFAWMGTKKIKFLTVVCGAWIANALVLINSRGAFVGAVVSLSVFLFFMIFSRYQKKGQRASAVVMIVLGLSGALYVTDDVFWERMKTLQSEDKAVQGSSRTSFWWTTFDILNDHPMGVGIQGYQALAPIYMDDQMRGGVENRAVHSMWFQGLSEIGWIGFGLFIAMLASLWRLSTRAKKYLLKQGKNEAYFKLLALECALLGYLVAGSFIDRFRAEILYWMILFVAVGVNIYYLQKKENAQVDKCFRSNGSFSEEKNTS